MLLDSQGYFPGGEAGIGPHPALVLSIGQRPEIAQVDNDAARTRAVAAGGMTTAADRDLDLVRAREIERRRNVLRIGHADDQGRLVVPVVVRKGTRLVVFGMFGPNDVSLDLRK